MVLLIFKKFLVYSMLFSFVCEAKQANARWAVNSLENLTMRIEAAQMDLSLDLVDSSEEQAQRILSPMSFELFKAQKKSIAESSWKPDWRTRKTFVARSSVDYSTTSMPLPGFTVKTGQKVLMYLDRSIMYSLYGARGKYGADEFMKLSYSPELGLRPLVTLNTYSNDGYYDRGFSINYAFQVDCTERIYVDTFMSFKVPFLNPDHILYCQLPDDRGFIGFLIKDPNAK